MYVKKERKLTSKTYHAFLDALSAFYTILPTSGWVLDMRECAL